MIFTATSGKQSLNNIGVYDRIADVNAIGGRFFRIAGSNKVFDIKDILTKPAENTTTPQAISGLDKYNKKQEILEQDILPEVWPNNLSNVDEYKRDLLDLINGRKLKVDNNIRIKYEGKIVELDTTLYSRQAYNGEPGAEEQLYYKTENETFLKKEKITPPAFKQMTQEEIELDIGSDGKDLYTGANKEFALIKYVDDEGKAHYCRDSKIQYVYNPETQAYDAKLTIKTKKDEKIEEVTKTISNVGVPEASVSTSIKVTKRFTNGARDIYAIYNDDGTVKANIQIDQPESENKKIRIHHKVGGALREISITNNAFIVGDFVCPLKSCNVKFVPGAEKKEGNLVLNLDVLSYDNVLTENDKIVGLIGKNGKTLRLDKLPFGIKLEGKIKNAVNSKIAVYKESKIFDNQDDKSVVVADVIQRTDIGPDGDIGVYDYGDRQRIFREFEKNIEELKRLAKEGISSPTDLEKMQNLKKLIDEQIGKLGDYETAKEVKEKREQLEAEEAKTGADRDQAKIDLAKQEYEKALEKAKSGYFKDVNNLATIDDMISEYQQGKFFNTFYFDENGNKVEIKSGELTTVTSNLPFDWSKSKAVESILGKDKIAFNKNTGKAEIPMSDMAKEVAVGSAKLAGLALNLSFTGGPISLLFMPFGVMIATACITVSGVTVATEMIRTKVKQARLNSMTPQKLKDMQDLELEKCIEKEFKKAYEQYKEDIKHAEKNCTSPKNLKELKEQAEIKLTETRKGIYRQYMLSAHGSITSNFSNKDKKITNENLYGFLEYRRRTKEAKKGEDFDFDAKIRLEEAKKEYERKKKEAKQLYKTSDPKYYKILMDQLKLEYDNVENEYYSEHGPLRSRESYLKKTEKYKKATKEERLKMLEECRESVKNFRKNLKVEEVSVKGRGDGELEIFRKRIITLAQMYMPAKDFKGKDFDDIDTLEHDDLKVPISVSNEEKHLEQTHDESEEFVETQEAFKEYVKVSEKCKEALDSKDKTVLTSTADELFNIDSETKDRLKNMVGEELYEKILENKAMWFDEKKSKSEIRQLKDFVTLLETTYNTEETRNKYLLDKYDDVLVLKINEILDKLKDEFKEDEEVLSALNPASVKRCKQYIFKKYPNQNSRYGLMGENEKFIKFLNSLDSSKDLKEKKDLLMEPFKAIEKIMDNEAKNLQKKILAKYSTLSDKTKDAVDKEFSVIVNYGPTSEITRDEFMKAVRRFEIHSKSSEKEKGV